VQCERGVGYLDKVDAGVVGEVGEDEARCGVGQFQETSYPGVELSSPLLRRHIILLFLPHPHHLILAIFPRHSGLDKCPSVMIFTRPCVRQLRY
jgi:hypothetical protein